MKRRAPLAVGLILLVFGLLILSGYRVQAKELTHRLGVGYSNQFSYELPSLAARYWSSPDMAFGMNLGVNTDSDDSKFGLGARFLKVIFPEDSLNFYMGAGAGLLSRKYTNASNTSVNDSGFELSGFCGVEFFLPNLDSIGINFEAGVGIASFSNGVVFRTIADHPLRAGMFFYF